MSSYVDTELIECSRRSSVESLSGNNDNNAIFTNKLGNGVKLNVGDTISIHSAIINERGAGSETIELKGNIIGESNKTYTNIQDFTIKDDYLDSGYINVLNRVDAQEIGDDTKTLDLKDNQVHMTIEYYKATNGENCFSLPRRFVTNNTTDKTDLYNELDCFEAGAPFRPQRNGTIVEVDYSRDRNASSPWASTWINNRELLKVRQDGTKYLIFVRQGATFYNVNGSVEIIDPILGPVEIGANVDAFLNGNGSLDPCYGVYRPYKELKTIEIPKGRRSANFISETFTNSLQNASNLEGYDLWFNQNNPSTSLVWSNQGVLAGVYKTSTFKPFNCATGSKFRESYMNESFTFNYNASKVTQNILDWFNNFQYIGFKRPDFVLAGRENLPQNYLTLKPQYRVYRVNNDSSVGRTKMKISINASYTQSNCEKFSNWFKTQKLYPEFWDFRNSSGKYYNNSVKLTPNNSRFLHIDMVQAYDNASKTLAVDRNELGSDCYYGNASTDIVADLSSIIKYDTPSEPLFITFIPDDEDSFYTNPIYDGENKKLSYGCMAKGPDDSIQFITEGVGGVPEGYYNASGFFIGGWEAVGNASYTDSKYTRYIGYDFHFTAYGNAGIGLWTSSFAPDFADNTRIGFSRLTANGTEQFDVNGSRDTVINQVYIGSSNPKLTYDPTKDRFGFTDFYTPEYLGNRGGAGDNGTLNPVKEGTALVYKINKRLRKQAFCPGMGPYTGLTDITITQTYKNASGQKGANVKVDFDLPNKNIYPFSIMDCHSGICISDFGINEKTWDNSLMGILGFSYSQLQSPVSIDNTIQNRVNTFNQNKLNKVTTQAIIKAEDTLIYNQNIFGGIMYHPEILSTVYINNKINASPPINQWNPPLNIETTSLTLTAEGVPKSMLNPFFSIRSNIIDDTSAYLGSVDSGQNLPTMGTILKNYNSGDYFYGEESSVTFTVTKPKTITSITTSINDPDGSFCRVDDSSAVIYKIQRNKQYPVNLFEEFMKKK